MKEFNLRNYLYNNPLLEEEKEEVKAKKKVKEAKKEDKKEDKKPKKAKKSKEEDLKENKLRGYIRERITSILQEAEDEDVDVDEEEDVDVDVEKDVNIDVEDEIDIDDESVESDIEVKSEIPGEDSDTAALLGLLTKAQEEAEGMGDEKLLDQIGNTITYFTRAHVVKSDQTRGAADIN
tara:strand:- start:534 stop:1070 length:537 start_codon:yes stop_codon:yes gene_type:complete